MSIPTSTAKYDLNNIASYPGSGNTLYDLGVNNYDITLSNTSYITEPLYNSLEFLKGSSSKGTFSGSMGLGTTTPVFTFFMWVKPIDLSSGVNFGWFISYGKELASIGGAPMILGEYSGSPNLSISFGSGVGLYNSGVALTIGEWACLTFTCDGTTNKLYLNGSLLGSVAKGAGEINTPEELAINYLTQTSVGYISYELNYLEIFDTALTAGEVTELYNNTANRFDVNLVTKLDFSNPASYPGSGTAVYDLTANNNDFAFQNTNFTYTTTYGGEVLIDNTNILQTSAPLSGFSYGTTAVSMNIWMQLNVEGGANLSMFAALNDTGGAGSHNVLFFGTQTGPTLFFNDNTDQLFQNTTFPLNTWKMITLTKPANGGSDSVKMYVDGVQVTFTSSGTSTPINLASSNSFIDSVVANLGVWSCDMTVGEYAIWDVELSSTDVLTYYNSTKARFDNLITKYDFQDPTCYPGTGNTVYDIEGNTNLVVAGGTWVSGSPNYWDLNSTTELVNTNPGAGFASSVFTVNCWYYYDTPVGAYSSVWGIGLDGLGTMPVLSVPQVGNSNIQWSFGQGLIDAGVVSGWNLFTFWSDGTDTKLYLNGVFVNTVNYVGSIASPYTIRLGCSSNASNAPYQPAEGRLGYWDYWNTALSAGQILDIYNNTSGSYIPAPPSYQGIVGGRQFGQGFNG